MPLVEVALNRPYTFEKLMPANEVSGRENSFQALVVEAIRLVRFVPAGPSSSIFSPAELRAQNDR